MADLDTIEHTIPRRLLITGLPGSGKSTLAAQLAAHGFILDWFDLENAGETLIKLPQEVKKNVKYYKLPDTATFPVGSQTLMQLFKKRGGKFCVTHGVVDCKLCTRDNLPMDMVNFVNYPRDRVLVVDTATQLGFSILSHLTKDMPIDFRPERDTWGSLRKFTEFFASEFQGFPGNLIVIAHLMEAQMPDGRTKLVPNFGSAAMSSAFAKAFSHVVYIETAGKVHKAYSSSTALSNVLTKSRTDWEIEKLDKPSLFPLFAPMLEAPPEGSLVIEGSATTVADTQNLAEVIQLANPKDANAPAGNALAALQAKYGLKK